MRISDWSSDVCSSDLIEGLAGGSAVGGEADLLDLRLGFAQLGIAVALQRGAAVVVADGAVQRALALLQLADDRLQLVERQFERHRADIGGNGVVCHGSVFRLGLFWSESRCVGKKLLIRVDLGGRRFIKKKKK